MKLASSLFLTWFIFDNECGTSVVELVNTRPPNARAVCGQRARFTCTVVRSSRNGSRNTGEQRCVTTLVEALRDQQNNGCEGD